jgi:DNA-binding transcriptional LysR family regulator
LVSNENFTDLIEKRTDVAIRIGGLTDSGLHARLLGRSVLHLVASPNYLEEHGTPASVDELTQHVMIGFTDISNLNKLPTIPAVSVPMNLKASSGETIRQLCLAGNGIALLSHFMVDKDIQAGKLVSLLTESITSPHPREQVQAVYYKHTALATRIDAFLNFIKTRLVL